MFNKIPNKLDNLGKLFNLLASQFPLVLLASVEG